MSKYIILIALCLIPLIVILPLVLSDLNPDMQTYKHDVTNDIKNPYAKCIDLKIISSVSGHGLWSLDSNESKIQQLANDRLEKGNCKA